MDRCPAWWTTAGAPRPVAETRAAPYAGLASACSESFQKTQHCDWETHADGSRWRRCREVQQCFRTCPGRPPEEVSMTSVETLQPLDEATAAPSQPRASTAGSQQQGHASSGGAPVPVDVGRLFDEFFQFASELERSLSSSGALHQIQEQQKVKDGDPSSFLQRIFGKKSLSGSKNTKGDMDLFVQYASGPSQEI